MRPGAQVMGLSIVSSYYLRFACELALLSPIVFGDVLENDDCGLWRSVGDVHHRICNHARQLFLLGGGAPAPHLYSHDRHRSSCRGDLQVARAVSRSQRIPLECVSQMLTSLLELLTRPGVRS